MNDANSDLLPPHGSTLHTSWIEEIVHRVSVDVIVYLDALRWKENQINERMRARSQNVFQMCPSRAFGNMKLWYQVSRALKDFGTTYVQMLHVVC